MPTVIDFTTGIVAKAESGGKRRAERIRIQDSGFRI
jgi:hypothetical protein